MRKAAEAVLGARVRRANARESSAKERAEASDAGSHGERSENFFYGELNADAPGADEISGGEARRREFLRPCVRSEVASRASRAVGVAGVYYNGAHC